MPKNNMSLIERGPVPAIILVLICAICVALLALTADVTADARAYQAQWLADTNKRALYPLADDFPEETLEQAGEGIPGAETVDLAQLHPEVYMVAAVHTGGEVTGLIIGVASKGYGGKVPVMVGFDLSGTIVGIHVDASGETPGLGQKTADTSFTDQYLGRLSDDSLSDIDAVTSATISSNAVTASVREASFAYDALMREGGK